MPTLEQARAEILRRVEKLAAESVPLADGAGRVLAEDLVAPRDMPAWDNSAMDGYAVRAETCVAGRPMPVTAYIPAGARANLALQPGAGARIMTGAPLPTGADAIVPLEEAEEREDAFVPTRPVSPWTHVRRKGEDLRAGDVVLRAGALLEPVDVAVLAAFGRASVPVVRRPRVAILSTGDELLAPGEPLSPGRIYDSNGAALAAAARQAGAEPVMLGIARDERDDLERKLAEGLRADVLVTSAGVSAGDRDQVREVLAALSVRQVFWKVDVKPGRPTAFAMHEATPVFSLPGNPVSSLLMFEELVRPALLRIGGHAAVLRPVVRAVFEDTFEKTPGRLTLVRVRLERRGDVLHAWSSGVQDTGRMSTMLRAHGVALVPAECARLAPGAQVDVQVLRGAFETPDA